MSRALLVLGKRMRDALDDVRDDFGREQVERRIGLGRPVGRLIRKGTEPADLVGPAVVRLHLGGVDWPAGPVHSGPRLEVDRVERTSDPSLIAGRVELPVERRAADASGTRPLHPDIRVANAFARALTVRTLVSALPATLQDCHPQTCQCHLACNRDAGGPAADDAQVGLDALAIRYRSTVDEHANPPEPEQV